MRTNFLMAVSVLFLPATMAIAGPSPSAKCAAAKHKASGAFHLCVRKAVAKAVKTGVSLNTAVCHEAFTGAWDKAEEKGGGDCPDLITDAADIDAYLTAWTTSTSDIIAGSAAVPACGDNDVNRIGELCDGSDLDSTSCTSLGFDSGDLACDGTCKFDATGCIE